MCIFTLADLFVVGVALDITGAALLARGLLTRPDLIGKLSGSYWDWNARDAVDRVRNRVDAEFGVAFLVAGFLLQFVGYVLELLGVSISNGAVRAAVAGGLALIASAAAYACWKRLQGQRVLRTLVQVALAHEGSGEQGDEKRAGWTRKKAAKLLSYGEAADYPILEKDEPDRTKTLYIQRVFGIEVPEDQI
jgi:hypothetical protein